MQMEDTTLDITSNAVVQLGENLYKNVYGVLIEYITNSYDADASFVNITVKEDSVEISDDGIGMSLQDIKNYFLKVGINRRDSLPKVTQKGRLPTGRKGFGKLACFGLFNKFELSTIKNNKQSFLVFDSSTNDKHQNDIKIKINSSEIDTSEKNGTTITLSSPNKKIPGVESLSSSIAKRINLMYDHSTNDSSGFIINISDTKSTIKIDKQYRDNLIFTDNNNIRFKYEIPKELKSLNQSDETIEYFNKNNIVGTIIARNTTSKIKENKGIVLFCRNKLCQEATFLDINTSNSYGYAHLYGEIHVDFIDDDMEDNIATDRTALRDTETTSKLKDELTKVLKAYANRYDNDVKKEKEKEIEEIKKDPRYKKLNNHVNRIQNFSLRTSVLSIVNSAINAITNKNREETLENLENTVSNIVEPISVPTEQMFKNEPKDNIATSYDHLLTKLRKKYNLKTKEDGDKFFTELYSGNKSRNIEIKHKFINITSATTQSNMLASGRNFGMAFNSIRNIIYHENDRECIQSYISEENSKRFISAVDLLLEIDNILFDKKS